MHSSSNSNNRGHNNNHKDGCDQHHDQETFPVFLLSQSIDPDSPLSGMPPFVVNRSLQAENIQFSRVDRLRNCLLIKVIDKLSSDKLLCLEQLGDIAVSVSLHRTLFVRCWDLKLRSKEEIIQELNPQGVTDCYNITVQEGNIKRQTNTFILTFNWTEPPKYIMVGSYELIKVDIYIPNPLRCFKCQQFGHGQRNCQRMYVHSVERMITNMMTVKVTPQNVPIALVLMLHTPKNAQGGRLSMRSRKSKHIQVSHSLKHAECSLESIALIMVNLRITMLLLSQQKHHIGKC